MEKTLGQIYGDAVEDQKQKTAAATWGDRHAAGIAAVANHVVAEAMAAHVAECHWPAKHDASDVYGPVKPRAAKIEPPQAEAGDWAMTTALQILCHSFSQESMANSFREAAERHYASIQKRLADNHARTIQERDALRRERDEAASDRDVWKQSYLNMVEGEPAKNQQRLLDKAVDDCAKLRQRAEAAEAALGEIKEAMKWSLENTAVGWSVANSEWEVWKCGVAIAKAKDRTDAILAAYRANNTKVASAAEGAVKS